MVKVFIKETAKEKRGWSLYKLAQIMELPQQTVYSWASGRTQPSWESMDRLCTVLGCTLDDMFKPEHRETFSPETLISKRKHALTVQYQHYKKLVEGCNP